MKSLYLYIKITILAVLLYSCSYPQIQVEDFTHYYNVKPNDTTKIKWKFKNADKVMIEGYGSYFNAKDSLEIISNEYKRLKFVAYYKGLDSLVLSTIIDVKKDTINEKINIEQKEKSIYFNNPMDEKRLINQIKIAGYFFDKSSNELNIRILPIDEYGGWADDSKLRSQIVENFKLKNKDEELLFPLKIEKVKNFDITNDITILLDNSIQSDNKNLIPKIKNFINTTKSNDKFELYEFSSDLTNSIPKSKKGEFLKLLNSYKYPQAEGLNSLFKSSYKVISKMANIENEQKYLIVITYNTDNSSIIFTAEDLHKLSKEFNIPIYIIALGDGLTTYTLRYITNSTGGKFYHLIGDEINSLDNVLREIYLSRMQYYNVKLNLNLIDKSYQSLSASLKINLNDEDYFDKTQIILKPQSQYVPYQALAVFDFKSDTYNKIFDNNLKDLSEILSINSDIPIELIGHSGNEGDDETASKLGLNRAKIVKEKLIEYGASESQIKIKSNSNKKPLFFFESEIWQGYLNRRVEIKWLDPSVLPYEIIGSHYSTEDEALDKVELWNNRGYKAYYDRISEKNNSYYRIKIWGFATYEEASNALKKINKDYKENFYIE